MTDTSTDLDESQPVRARPSLPPRASRDSKRCKVEFLGKKGAITAQLKSLGTLAPDARRDAGARINAVRDETQRR